MYMKILVKRTAYLLGLKDPVGFKNPTGFLLLRKSRFTIATTMA
jgi:hypothetical protein